MSNTVKKMNIKYTYGDYINWPEDERWELINGYAYDMSPAPSRIHQKISGEIFGQIWSYLRDKPCEVYDAPFDVRLSKEHIEDKRVDTVVQPDIVVVCDRSKLDDRGCMGSPDMIVEILSPNTAKRDLKDKLELYEKFGVREYWIVHPIDKTLMLFKLMDDKKYGRYELYSDDDKVKVGIFEDLEIDLGTVFKDEEKEEKVQEERL